MDQEGMVVAHLTDELIQSGEQLTIYLDNKMIIKASMWILERESNSWKFVIGTPEVTTKGPRKIYSTVQAALEKNHSISGITLSDIAVVSMVSPIISLMKVAISTGKAIQRLRFTRTTINGFFVEDALIYRMQ